MEEEEEKTALLSLLFVLLLSAQTFPPPLWKLKTHAHTAKRMLHSLTDLSYWERLDMLELLSLRQ